MLLHIRVQSNSSRNRLIVEDDGRLRLCITTPPVDGKANKAIISLLAKWLKVPKRSISIISGELSREKRIFIEDISVETVSYLVNEVS